MIVFPLLVFPQTRFLLSSSIDLFSLFVLLLRKKVNNLLCGDFSLPCISTSLSDVWCVLRLNPMVEGFVGPSSNSKNRLKRNLRERCRKIQKGFLSSMFGTHDVDDVL